MNLADLNFDQIPPIDIPFRFYFCAALFAIVAGVFMVFNAEQIWLTRWSAASLSITHLLVLGVIAMTMFGSLFQLLPVLCGAPIVMFGKLLIVFQGTFILGILTLIAAFNAWFSFLPAVVLLALSLLLFITFLLNNLLFKAGGIATKHPMLLAVFSLLVTVLLGLILAVNNVPLAHWGAFGLTAMGKSLTHVHAAFGFFGWVVLLVMTVGFQVIPMFHVTPEFPKFSRYIPFIVATELVVITVAMLLVQHTLWIYVILLVTVAVYAVIALIQLSQRKRKLPDTTVMFWQLALSCLFVGCMVLAVNPLFSVTVQIKLEILAAITLSIGFVLSVVLGMLLKIIPFLITLHLQQHVMNYPLAMGLMPDHYSLIPRVFGQRLFKLHGLTLVLTLSSVLYVPLMQVAGGLLAISWGYLAYQIGCASKQYRVLHKKISETQLQTL